MKTNTSSTSKGRPRRAEPQSNSISAISLQAEHDDGQAHGYMGKICGKRWKDRPSFAFRRHARYSTCRLQDPGTDRRTGPYAPPASPNRWPAPRQRQCGEPETRYRHLSKLFSADYRCRQPDGDDEASKMESNLSRLGAARRNGQISEAEYKRRVAELRALGETRSQLRRLSRSEVFRSSFWGLYRESTTCGSRDSLGTRPRITAILVLHSITKPLS